MFGNIIVPQIHIHNNKTPQFMKNIHACASCGTTINVWERFCSHCLDKQHQERNKKQKAVEKVNEYFTNINSYGLSQRSSFL